MARRNTTTSKENIPAFPYSVKTSSVAEGLPRQFVTSEGIDFIEKAAVYLKDVTEKKFPKDTITFSMISLALQKLLVLINNARATEDTVPTLPCARLVNDIYNKRTEVAHTIDRIFTSGNFVKSVMDSSMSDPAIMIGVESPSDIWKLVFIPQIIFTVDTKTALTYVVHYVLAELDNDQLRTPQDVQNICDFLLYVVHCDGFNAPPLKALNILLNFSEIDRPCLKYPHYIDTTNRNTLATLEIYAIAYGVSILRTRLLSLKAPVVKQIESGDTATKEISLFEATYVQYVNLQTFLTVYLQYGAEPPIAHLIKFVIAKCFADANLQAFECALPFEVVRAWELPEVRHRAMSNLASDLQIQYTHAPMHTDQDDMSQDGLIFGNVCGQGGFMNRMTKPITNVGLKVSLNSGLESMPECTTTSQPCSLEQVVNDNGTFRNK